MQKLDRAKSDQVAIGRGTLGTTLRPINPAVHQLLVVYRRLLESRFEERLVQLTLFGSYARGEARADSDIDVAVVLDAIRVPSERTLPMELAGDLVAEYGQVIVPLVLSVSELELLGQREDLLAANLEREGIAL